MVMILTTVLAVFFFGVDSLLNTIVQFLLSFLG